MTDKKPIPAGVTPKEHEIARDIIVEGNENGVFIDQIYTDLIKNGIVFNRVMSVYNAVALNEGIIRNPAKVREDIKAIINRDDIDYSAYTDYAQHIQPIVDHVLKHVEGSTEPMILRCLKSKFSLLDIKMPKKPRTRAIKWSQVELEIVNYFADAYPDVSKIAYDGIVDTFAPKSAAKWKRLYPIFECIAAGDYSDKLPSA